MTKQMDAIVLLPVEWDETLPPVKQYESLRDQIINRRHFSMRLLTEIFDLPEEALGDLLEHNSKTTTSETS